MIESTQLSRIVSFHLFYVTEMSNVNYKLSLHTSVSLIIKGPIVQIYFLSLNFSSLSDMSQTGVIKYPEKKKSSSI